MPESAPHEPVTAGSAGQFLLEVVGLIGIARLGWHLGEGSPWRIGLAALFVALAGGLWGLFRTPGFVPNGKPPTVPIPGPLRLAIELFFFAVASWGLWVSGWNIASAVMIIGTVIVYWTLRDRTMDLFWNRQPNA